MSKRGASVEFRGDTLAFKGKGERRDVPASAIEEIMACELAPPLDGGDEPFHILLLADGLVVVGPFVSGGVGAIDALRQAYPHITWTQQTVENIPYRFRAPGVFGLRLFPEPGLCFAAKEELAAFRFVKPRE
ncbi:MAG: hypothetical protein AAGB11_16190 [Pseudomonadota bacterium]